MTNNTNPESMEIDKDNKKKCANILNEFKEVDEVRSLIENLENIYADQISVETAHERYLCEFMTIFSCDS